MYQILRPPFQSLSIDILVVTSYSTVAFYVLCTSHPPMEPKFKFKYYWINCIYTVVLLNPLICIVVLLNNRVSKVQNIWVCVCMTEVCVTRGTCCGILELIWVGWNVGNLKLQSVQFSNYYTSRVKAYLTETYRSSRSCTCRACAIEIGSESYCFKFVPVLLELVSYELTSPDQNCPSQTKTYNLPLIFNKICR